MNESTALVTIPEVEIRLGSLAVTRPSDMIVRASEVATALAQVVKDRKLSRNISGREYVYVEGWATMGAMIGILPREVGVLEHDNGDFEATVELIRVNDGAVVGQGSAIVGYDEPTWKARPRYAKRSMSITRATGKAYRLGFSWIMALAGYAPTPAEEMDGITDIHADATDAEWHAIPSATQERAALPTTNGKPSVSRPAPSKTVVTDEPAPKLAANRAPAMYANQAAQFAQEFPDYQTKYGVFDDGHIRASLMTLGFAELTPENIEVAFGKLAEHALSKLADAVNGK